MPLSVIISGPQGLVTSNSIKKTYPWKNDDFKKKVRNIYWKNYIIFVYNSPLKRH